MARCTYLLLLSAVINLLAANGLIITLSDGTRGSYTGQLRRGLPNGLGTVETTDGLVVDGTFEDGQIVGMALYMYEDGKAIMNKFENGRKEIGTTFVDTESPTASPTTASPTKAPIPAPSAKKGIRGAPIPAPSAKKGIGEITWFRWRNGRFNMRRGAFPKMSRTWHPPEDYIIEFDFEGGIVALLFTSTGPEYCFKGSSEQKNLFVIFLFSCKETYDCVYRLSKEYGKANSFNVGEASQLLVISEHSPVITLFNGNIEQHKLLQKNYATWSENPGHRDKTFSSFMAGIPSAVDQVEERPLKSNSYHFDMLITPTYEDLKTTYKDSPGSLFKLVEMTLQDRLNTCNGKSCKHVYKLAKEYNLRIHEYKKSDGNNPKTLESLITLTAKILRGEQRRY